MQRSGVHSLIRSATSDPRTLMLLLSLALNFLLINLQAQCKQDVVGMQTIPHHEAEANFLGRPANCPELPQCDPCPACKCPEVKPKECPSPSKAVCPNPPPCPSSNPSSSGTCPDDPNTLPGGTMQKWVANIEGRSDIQVIHHRDFAKQGVSFPYNPKDRWELEIWDYVNRTGILGYRDPAGFRMWEAYTNEKDVGWVQKFLQYQYKEQLRGKSLHDGFRRVSALHGSEYILRYTNPSDSRQLVSVHIARPLNTPKLTLSLLPSPTCSAQNRVHIIVPLSGRSTMLKLLLETGVVDSAIRSKDTYFERDCVTFTVYYMPTPTDRTFDDQKEYEAVQKALQDSVLPESAYHIVYDKEAFGRAVARYRGAQAAIEHFKADSAKDTIFFTDVDMWFSGEFLQRCQLTAIHDRSVYFPLVFSQYNPEVIQPSNPKSEFLRRRVDVFDLEGHWRFYGSGMFCASVGNYLKYNSFGRWTAKKWGGEDKDNFNAFVSSPLEVVRAIEPGLVHRWHGKVCSRNTVSSEYNNCIEARARTEGSREQLAKMLLRLRDKCNAK